MSDRERILLESQEIERQLLELLDVQIAIREELKRLSKESEQ